MTHPETPPDIKSELSSLGAVTGTHTRRRDLEMRYYMFHKKHGTKLRGKYRP